MTIKAVIFDMDGTITRPFLDFDAIRGEMGLAADAGPILEVMQKMTPSQRRDAQEVLDRYETEAVEQSSLNSGARSTLDSLRERGIKIGILTRNIRRNVFAISEKHGLEFDAVFGRDDGPAKPDAAGVLHLCKEFGVEPHQAIMAGDYLFDLQAGRNAGAVSVWLKNDGNVEKFDEFADFTIDNLSEILQIIDNEL